MMVIHWDTASDDRHKYHDGTFVSRFGSVDGVRRFQIKHVPECDPKEDRWQASDMLAPEGTPNTVFVGSYLACVEWCFKCGSNSGA